MINSRCDGVTETLFATDDRPPLWSDCGHRPRWVIGVSLAFLLRNPPHPIRKVTDLSPAPHPARTTHGLQDCGSAGAIRNVRR